MTRPWLVALGLCVGAVAAAQEPATTTPEQQARAHYNLGSNHIKLGEYDAAIADFQAGYKLKPLPLFLFNIAQAARVSGKAELAVEYYQQYIEAETLMTAPELIVARQQLEALRAPALPPPTPPPAEPAPAAVAAPTTHAAPPPVVAQAVETRAPAAPARRPVWKRGWFWGTMAVIVAVGVGVGVGVGIGARPTPPQPSLGVLSF
ncbi:MAG: tetratricopeptide repeat protein [Polyangia bacterium]